jgi:3-hydroxyacyl-CoA dehydrogenase/enoyl-CoA hydratase/3-hydroxybutyryl-CoA epimerase
MAFFQTKNLWIHLATEDVAVLMLDVPGKANYLNESVLRDLDQALDIVAEHSALKQLVICSGKEQSFCHGLDDAAWQRLTRADDARRLCDLGLAVCKKLAEMRLPTTAWIAGPCLGAGLDLALACDQLVVCEDAGTALGFVEIELGMIPMWGGITRLAARVGIERSFQMLIGSRKLRPSEALSWGLADHVLEGAAFEVRRLPANLGKRGGAERPRRTFRQRWIERFAWGRALIFRRMRKLLEDRLPDGLKAPAEVLKVLRAGPEHGLAQTRDSVLSLAELPALGNFLRLQRLREQARLPAPDAKPNQRIGIVGASGRALALVQTAALKGCDIVFREPDEKALGMTIFGILQNLNAEARRGLLAPKEIEGLLARIHSTVSWKGFGDVGLVIHTGDGDRDTHEKDLREIAAEIPASTPLATTSPWLTMERLRELLPHPNRIMRLSFPTPIGKIPLVEMHHVRDTSPAAQQRFRDFAVLLGKTPIRVRDQAGFLLDRLWYPAWNEILILIREGIDADRLDTILFRFGMAYSPLEYLDLIGLDNAYAYALTMKPIFGERLPPDDAWELLFEKGWLGRKSGQGLFRYHRRVKRGNRFLANLLRQDAQRVLTFHSRDQEAGHVCERIAGLTINEAFRCVEEGVVENGDVLDLMLMLSGWAPHRGGPIRYAESTGLAHWVETLERHAKESGPRFTPCAELLKRAASSERSSPRDS